jgi:hypothetical protein
MSLDLSSNSSLQFLSCESCASLRNLDISTCVGLVGLDLAACPLPLPDLSSRRDLMWLKLPNAAGELDFSSSNPRLNCLVCGSGLTNLNVSGAHELVYLDCSINWLWSLDVSQNPELEHLDCYGCGLAALEISCNPALVWLNAHDNAIVNNPEQGYPIDTILAKLDGFGLSNGFVDISGGSNAPPTEAATQNIANLQARGWSVDWNPLNP